MHRSRIASILVLLALTLATRAWAAPFVVFPDAGRLVSPDGRFEVRDAGREAAASEFVGTFHALWLVDVASGRSRKLCDYLGVAAVAWSGNDFVVITQYVGKKSSRALVFATNGADQPVMLDSASLIQMLPIESRAPLRENDHVFIEALRLDHGTFYFHVWGYGKHDWNGFQMNCEYGLSDGNVTCAGTNKK
jgi:hypothetical protein